MYEKIYYWSDSVDWFAALFLTLLAQQTFLTYLVDPHYRLVCSWKFDVCPPEAPEGPEASGLASPATSSFWERSWPSHSREDIESFYWLQPVQSLLLVAKNISQGKKIKTLEGVTTTMYARYPLNGDLCLRRDSPPAATPPIKYTSSCWGETSLAARSKGKGLY